MFIELVCDCLYCNECADQKSEKIMKRIISLPKGPSSGANRVSRSGSFSFNAGFCRVPSRHNISPDYHGNILGFRLVLEP